MFGLNRFQLLCLAYITFGSAFYGYDSGMCYNVTNGDTFLTLHRHHHIRARI